MSSQDACIWVLVTDGVTARICSTGDGTATSILEPRFPSGASAGEADTDRDARLYRAWFKSDAEAGLASGKRQFAAYLARILHEGASERAFDGLIVIAAPEIFSELRREMSMAVRALLIGEVVHDLPNAGAVKADFGIELRH